jgi:hypothetical protein
MAVAGAEPRKFMDHLAASARLSIALLEPAAMTGFGSGLD